MEEAIARTVRRWKNSSFTAGAMHRLFIGIGKKGHLDRVLALLGQEGLEPIPGKMNMLGLFPMEFLQHQGTHFNRKLFVLEGIDELIEKMGEELFRRIEFERRQFTRTATWTLLWFQTEKSALNFRESSSGTWNLADDISYFPEPESFRSLKSIPSEGAISHLSGLGEVLFPVSIAQLPLKEILTERKRPEIRFWGDLIRLSPQDALLTFFQSVQMGISLFPEAPLAAQILAQEVGLCLSFENLKNEIKKINPESSSWISLGEKVLKEVDEKIQKGEGETSLLQLKKILESWLTDQAYLLADRPIRFSVILHRGLGHFSDSLGLLDKWEAIVMASGLKSLIVHLLEAKAQHAEEMGDADQAKKLRATMKSSFDYGSI